MSLSALLADDLAAVFASELSVAATVIPAAGGASYLLRGILRAPYRVQPLGQMETPSADWRFLCATADAASVRQGDRLQVEGGEYRVQDKEPSGYGLTTLKVVPR